MAACSSILVTTKWKPVGSLVWNQSVILETVLIQDRLQMDELTMAIKSGSATELSSDFTLHLHIFFALFH